MIFGYIVTIIVALSFVSLIVSAWISRNAIRETVGKGIDRNSAAALFAIIAFFVIFSALYVSPVERLYFDESIYQGIALNILHNGNALWCQYGTAYASSCYANQIYHDPVGWSVFIAIAFGIFGVGTGTAYSLQLLVGCLSILAVFLLSAALFKRRSIPLIAAAAFALNPQLIIWSRTQAVIDLPFMMLTTLTFFFFAVFLKRQRPSTLSLAAFSLVLTVYTRIEAFLMVPFLVLIYFVLGEKGVRKTIRERAAWLVKNISQWRYFAGIAVLVILLIPQAFYIASQAATGNYGTTGSQQLFSLSNFKGNVLTNIEFFFGLLSNVYSYYPVAFPMEITILAIIGIVLFAFDKEYKNRFGIISLLLIWILGYHLFYDFFYAGSALFGVDARFMLEMIPPLIVGAALGIYEIARYTRLGFGRISIRIKKGIPETLYAGIFSIVLFSLLIVWPFTIFAPGLTLPANQTPQEGQPLTAINFIYNNYHDVPANCLVFSFTPDIWYELNRSAAQVGYLGNNNPNFTSFARHFSCYVFDYGYWCSVPPYQGTTCSSTLSNYKLVPLVNTGQPLGSGYNFYEIENYTNPSPPSSPRSKSTTNRCSGPCSRGHSTLRSPGSSR